MLTSSHPRSPRSFNFSSSSSKLAMSSRRYRHFLISMHPLYRTSPVHDEWHNVMMRLPLGIAASAARIAYPGRNGVLLPVPLLLGADLDGVGHFGERPGLCGRLRGLLPSYRSALHGRG